ncbi:MAG TPA: ATP synthase F1 subunit gamma [Ignavibacteria bacterium]|nr:ATP synthase F1 subunit gamma [Ignavibacteria bacterium]HQY52431.1 ATP synthase F1 subunit gamma [Ignavibacteria bacterium]
MATLKELKVRISGIKSTQKITKAMKMVASAKLRRAQERTIAARPYAKKINELLTDLVSVAGEGTDELLESREIRSRCVVVVSSDRGLAGSFNTAVIRYAYNYIKSLGDDTKVVVIGKKAYDALKKRDVNIVFHKTGIFSDLTIEVSNEIVNFLVDNYKKKTFDSVEIIFNEFVTMVKQDTVKDQFLPLKKNKPNEKDGEKVKGKENIEVQEKKTAGDYIYEPSESEIIKELIPKQLKVQMWKVLLESNTSEHAARMTAMETATKNATDLIMELELTYNQARQAAITKEILEIVGGAEALKDA